MRNKHSICRLVCVVAGKHDRRAPRQGFPKVAEDGFKSLSPHDDRMPHGQLFEPLHVIRNMPEEFVLFPEGSALGAYGDHDAYLRVLHYATVWGREARLQSYYVRAFIGVMKSSSIKIKSILSQSSDLKDRFIPDYRELKRVVSDLKRMGYRVVLTQGVYDMIHEGHARYLEKALSYGDILIVGVDSDEMTRKRKGPNRPVVPQAERLQMLAHLRSVSILALRESKHGLGKLIHTVRPDVLITSTSTSDFGKKQVNEYKNVCGRIVILPPQAATSTTARVRLLTISGADQLAREIMQGVPQLVKNALDKFRNNK